MKIYVQSVWVGNYEIEAFGDSPEKCIAALVSAYNKNFGSFRANGFKNRADWLEYHGASPESCQAVDINKAIVR